MSILITALSFILVFLIVVIVHEFGHFWVARRCGVKILRFSVGFGRVLWRRIDKHGTEFALAMIPLGGYVKMLDGRERALEPAEEPFAFDHKSLLQRSLIVLAGPAFNFLFAIIIYMLILMIGVIKIPPIVGDVVPDSVGARAGIQVGDEFVSINGHRTQDWQSVYMTLLEQAGEPGVAQVEARQFPDKPMRHLELPNVMLNQTDHSKKDLLQEWGITLGLPQISAIVGSVVPDQPAALAGIQAQDEILAIDQEPVRDWYDLVNRIRHSPGKTLMLSVKRDQKIIDISLTPTTQWEEGASIGVVGIQLMPPQWPEEWKRVQRESAWDAIKGAVLHTWDLSRLTLVFIGKMITGAVSVENLSGPISIAEGAQESVQSGWLTFMSFLVLLSVNLGVINLLPIPMLDGGHLLYYVIESIRGRPLSEKAQHMGLIIGLAIVIGLMLVGLHNDIMGFLK